MNIKSICRSQKNYTTRQMPKSQAMTSNRGKTLHIMSKVVPGSDNLF